MNEDGKIFLYIAAIPLMAALVLGLGSGMRFTVFLSPLEQRTLAISGETVPIIPDRPSIDSPSLVCPVTLDKTSFRGFPETPLARISPPPTGTSPPSKQVSMILINKSRKIAVIDGQLVNEGDTLDHYRIAKIEKGRVLLKDKEGEKWLTCE